MKKIEQFENEFVIAIPEKLQAGVLYVSIEYATVAHLCCCGCGREVVTPLSPTDWKITYDGQTCSLNPSVGNWSFPCQSHYWIRDGKVRWAEQWSPDQIQAGRNHDRRAKAQQFGDPTDTTRKPTSVPEEDGLWARFKRWWQN